MKYESQQKNDYQTDSLDKHQKNSGENQHIQENERENKRPENQAQRRENEIDNQRNTDQKHRNEDQKNQSGSSTDHQKNRHNNQ